MCTLLAEMLDALGLAPGQRVLVAGTARAAELAASAVGGDGGVTVLAGPAGGAEAGDPRFDRILADLPSEQAPVGLLRSLADGGRLVSVLRGSLDAVVVRLTKTGASEARGRFLAHTVEPEPPPPHPAPAVEALLGSPLDAVRRWSERETQLWGLLRTPGSDLRLWLQWDVPGLSWHDVDRDGAAVGCLHHVPHQTLLLLDPGRRALEVRGDLEVWDRIASSHRRWLGAGQPGRTDYELVVGPAGRQVVACGNDRPVREWRLR